MIRTLAAAAVAGILATSVQPTLAGPAPADALRAQPRNVTPVQQTPAGNAQLDPRALLTFVDQSLQQGNVVVFGSQVSQIIFMQTGGTGVYQALVQLGPIGNVALGGVLQMPIGIVVQGRTFHQNGFADWTVGFSFVTRKIEILYFNVMPTGWPGGQPPGTAGASPPSSTTGGPSTTPAVPAGKDDACAKYPTLCEGTPR